MNRSPAARWMFTAAMMLIAANVFSPPLLAAASPGRPPATQSGQHIERWFEELADTDPIVREHARISLMGVSREELETLRRIVEENVPLAPAQSAVLRDIVIHAYLAGEPYVKNVRVGFLGAMLDDMMPVTSLPDDTRGEGRGVSGVVIRETIEGFCGFRYLRSGDVVLGVIGRQFYPTTMIPDLQARVMETLPGDSITLLVLRHGKVMRVAFRVDAQPIKVQQQPIEQFRNERMEQARQYWQEKFERLLAPDAVSVAPAVLRTAAEWGCSSNHDRNA